MSKWTVITFLDVSLHQRLGEQFQWMDLLLISRKEHFKYFESVDKLHAQISLHQCVMTPYLLQIICITMKKQ